MSVATWIEYESTSPRGETRTTRHYGSMFGDISDIEARNKRMSAEGWRFSEIRVVCGEQETLDQFIARKLA